MKAIIQTRFIHWKKQWKSIVFWLLFPILSSLLVMFLSDAIQDDAKVPVGIVLEEDTMAANELYDSIDQSSLIQTKRLTKNKAKHQLTKHELDSVFVIHKGFEENIHVDDRHQLVTSYRSDLSFTYPTVKEIIISHIHQETGRAKAALVVESLAEQYSESGRWTWEEIIEKSKLIELDQDLLRTNFSFDNEQTANKKQSDPSIINIWNIWALSALLGTLLLFDWPSKESHSKLRTRFAFIRMTMKQYLLRNLLLYIGLFMLIDLLTISAFYIVLDEPITLFHYGTVVTYRLVICIGAFLLSLCFQQVYSYYLVAFILCLLLAIGSGAIVPIDGLISHFQSIEWLNPLHAFVSNELSILWLIIVMILTGAWYIRKERANASR